MTKIYLEKKIKFKCRRGMLELDVILEKFILHETGLNQLSLTELETLDVLLDEADPVLYQWLLGYSEPEVEKYQMLVKKIREKEVE